MRLEYVTLHNAFSHKETTVRLADNGLCIVKGSNGAGKSSIVKGVIFAFFGIGTDDVVNNKIGKDTYVEVTGSDGDNRYRVRRYRNHTEHKNNLYFSINDEEIAGATNTALQVKLEAFLGCDYRSFTTIASFSNDMIMFANSTDSERKAIFEKILQDLDIYNDYNKTAKEKIVDLTTDVDELDHAIDVDERELQVVQKVLETEETRALVLEQKRMERLRELDDERTELEKKSAISVRLKGKRERYNNAIFRLEQWLEVNQSNAEEIQDADTELYMLDQKEGDLSFDICPVCGTKMTEKHRNKELKVIEKRRKVINKGLRKLEDYESLRAKVTDSMNRLFDRVSGLEYKLVKYETVPEKTEELDVKIKKATDQVGDSQDGLKLWKSKIRKLSKTVASAKRRIAKYEEELLYWKEVAHGFSKQGIPNIIITRALSMLETCANGYLDTLTSGAIGIKLTGMSKTKKGAVRNKIGINVVSESGVTSFGSYSGGERQRLNIALLLALRDVAEHNKGIKLNCLFLDEVLDLSLDDEGIEEVLQLLRIKKRAVDSIIVITPKMQMLHNTGVTFDTVMHVEKHAGFSTVEIKESV